MLSRLITSSRLHHLWVTAALAGAVAAPVLADEPPPLATEVIQLHGQAIEQFRVGPEGAAGTVVFENGSRAELEGWHAVIDGLRPKTGTTERPSAKPWALLAYNRPGIGRSEATERPRDGQQVVADLRQLLQQQNLRPPYILVGHSLGGLYMQLYARQYPGEVGGLLLVDAVAPGVIKKPEDFPFYTRWAKSLLLSRSAAREIDAIHATGEAVLALPWEPRIPVIRLVNQPKSAGAVAVDFGVVNDDPATIARARALYAGAKTVVVDSDHQIQKATPMAVVQAIRELTGGS